MLFKEQAVVIPALFVLCDALGLGDAPPRRDPASLLARHAPVALVVIGWFALRAEVLAHAEPVRLAAMRAPARVPLSFLHTLHALLAPSPTLSYEPAYTLSRATPGALLAVALAVALGRVTRGPAAAFGAGWALLAVLPTANLVTQETHFADRYALLAAPGLAAVIAAWMAPAWTDPTHAQRRTAGAAAVVILALIAHAPRRGVSRQRHLSAALGGGGAVTLSRPRGPRRGGPPRGARPRRHRAVGARGGPGAHPRALSAPSPGHGVGARGRRRRGGAGLSPRRAGRSSRRLQPRPPRPAQRFARPLSRSPRVALPLACAVLR
jgi:hypothetical protein